MVVRGPIRAASLALALAAGRAGATPVTSTTPGIDSPTVTPSGTADFLFMHRFLVLGSKVVNSPTFDLDFGLLSRFSLGARYATNSDIGTTPNELELLAKGWLLRQSDGRPLDLTAEAAYNFSGKSVDGALIAARRLDWLTLLATARGFSDIYDAGGAALAAAGGASIRLTRYLSLVGDVGGILAASSFSAIQATSGRVAWSGGIAFDIPYTPHSISLYATNANTHTLEGLSRGTDNFRVGFEFDIPLPSLARWKAIFAPSPAPPPAAPPPTRAQPSGPAAAPPGPGTAGPQAGMKIEVAIEALAYRPAEVTVKPGTTVRWENRDRVKHTVTGISGDWGSLVLDPGQVYEQRFDRPGIYPYNCLVHPFMRGTVVVK